VLRGEEGRRQGFVGMSKTAAFDPFRVLEVLLPVLLLR